jgi:uncharacterized damage-inducible protein DinB
MTQTTREEAWLSGPIEGVPPLLMPVAHALVQAREDAAGAVSGLGPEQLWMRPAGAASVGYHVQHLAGALDRLFTYARGETLTDEQQRMRAAESAAGDTDGQALLRELDRAVDRAMEQIRSTRESSLLEPRHVGRRYLPSTVLGLLFHAAEHATRHAGQAITTSKIVAGWPE